MCYNRLSEAILKIFKIDMFFEVFTIMLLHNFWFITTPWTTVGLVIIYSGYQIKGYFNLINLNDGFVQNAMDETSLKLNFRTGFKKEKYGSA